MATVIVLPLLLFVETSRNSPGCPGTFWSCLLGTDVFFNDGVEWLSDITENYPKLEDTPLPVNTIYYIEEYMCRYVKKQVYTFRSVPQHRQKVFNVLNFLVNKGSSLGFMLREEII